MIGIFRARPALLAVLAVAFGLRVYQLDGHGLWYDEAFTSWIVSKDWAGILDFARTPKLEHPPVYYFLLHAWTLLAGNTEFVLRFFSVFFSILTVPILFRFARRWFGPELARWVWLFACFSPFLVVYAQEARMYTLVIAVTLLALDAFLRWLTGERRAWQSYLIFTLLGLTIHYYAGLLLIVQNLFLIGRALPYVRSTGWLQWSWRAKQWVIWMVSLGVGAFLILAIAPGPRETLLLVFSQPLFAGRNIEELRRVMIDLVVGGVVIRPLTPLDLTMSVFPLVMLGVGALAWRATIRKSPSASLILWLVIIPPLVAAAVPLIYAARYLFMIIPAILLLTAAGFVALNKYPFARVLGIVTMAAASIYGLVFNYGFSKSDYREMAAIVNAQARPTDGLLLEGNGQWPLVSYYLGDWSAAQYIPLDSDHAELADIDGNMRSMQRLYPRVWVISSQAAVVDPGNNIARWLALNAYPVGRTWFSNGDAVALYESGQSLRPAATWNASFGDWLMLEQSALSSQAVKSGDGLPLELRWHAQKKIPQTLQLLVTLRLIDSRGGVVVERVTKPCDGFCPIDDWIPGETISDRHGLSLPRSLAAGMYSLRLEIFSPRQSQSLPIVMDGKEIGKSLALAEVAVGGVAASTPP